jgi:hypothetical protein
MSRSDDTQSVFVGEATYVDCLKYPLHDGRTFRIKPIHDHTYVVAYMPSGIFFIVLQLYYFVLSPMII